MANLHGHTCTTWTAREPGSIGDDRAREDQALDYLVLFDSVIVLDEADLKVVTDRRVDAFAQAEVDNPGASPSGRLSIRLRVNELVAAQQRHL